MYKILIVDDLKIDRMALVSLFKSEGYVVDSSSSPLDAYEIVKTGKYDLAVIDVKMPHEEEGIELASKIRTLESDRKIRKIGIFIIAIEATKVEAENAINECHADYFIEKPWDNEDLINITKLYFKHRIEEDNIIKAFKEWVETINPDDFKIGYTEPYGEYRSLNAKDILNEMVKGTEFGNNFKESLINISAQMIRSSIRKSTNKDDNSNKA